MLPADGRDRLHPPSFWMQRWSLRAGSSRTGIQDPCPEAPCCGHRAERGARLSWREKGTLGFSIGPFVQAFKLPCKGLLYMLPCPIWSRVLGFRALSGEDPGHLTSRKQRSEVNLGIA